MWVWIELTLFLTSLITAFWNSEIDILEFDILEDFGTLENLYIIENFDASKNSDTSKNNFFEKSDNLLVLEPSGCYFFLVLKKTWSLK